jgi:hypothetical protein
MFQFDGGTFGQTIERDGDGVLLLDGNVTRAVDFVVNMVINSQYVDADSAEEAKAWMNQVTVDGPHWDAWVTTVTHYYNGCTPSGCSVFDTRWQHYNDHGFDVFYEQGADFWVVELPPCAAIPAEGAMLEETDTCFTKGGPLPYWRVGIGGENNLHVWTGTTDAAEAVNFAEWRLELEEAGDYLVEISLAGGTSKTASYTIDHAGVSEDVIVDQSGGSGYVELGTFAFDAGGGQRVYVGDNTGEADGEKLAVDALRLTRIGAPPGTGGNGAGPSGSGGGEVGGAAEGGAAEGGAGGGDESDEGCSVSRTRTASGGSAGVLALLLGLGFVRRRR